MEQHRVPSQLALLSPSVRREFNMAVHWEGREEPGRCGVRQLGRQVGREELGHYIPRLESGLAEVAGNPAPCLQDLCRHPVTNPPARHIRVSVRLPSVPLCWVESFLQVTLMRYRVQELTQLAILSST